MANSSRSTKSEEDKERDSLPRKATGLSVGDINTPTRKVPTALAGNVPNAPTAPARKVPTAPARKAPTAPAVKIPKAVRKLR